LNELLRFLESLHGGCARLVGHKDMLFAQYLSGGVLSLLGEHGSY
jgi:hypothetical protein